MIALCSVVVAVAAAGPAKVKSESLAVYSEMSTTSTAVKTLKRGAAVFVAMSVATDSGEWCEIREPRQKKKLGYVRCESLERQPQPKRR